MAIMIHELLIIIFNNQIQVNFNIATIVWKYRLISYR